MRLNGVAAFREVRYSRLLPLARARRLVGRYYMLSLLTGATRSTSMVLTTRPEPRSRNERARGVCVCCHFTRLTCGAVGHHI